MTRCDIDTIRTNSILLSTIADKIAALEHIIDLRGTNFAREKELTDLKATYNLIANDDARNLLKEIITRAKLTPMQKAIFYDYYINGKTAKAVGADCCLCESTIYTHLALVRRELGFCGKCRTNNL